jgi:NAD(P)-dependent dehydrogenase (short-subunit alcohol dehydrogenase family)
VKYSIERMFDLKGQVAIVAGATGGLGTEICLALNELGVKLVLVGRRMEGLKALEARLNAKNAALLSISVDITCKARVQDMARAAADAFGRIDILVNCAGMSHLQKAVDFDESAWDRLLDVNLKGTFLTCQAVGSYMLAQEYGRIVNFSSVRGQQGRSQDLAYAPSKGAINQLTKSLAIEWAQSGINVNAIAPTFTPTELNRCLLADEPTRSWVLNRIPMGRLGEPEDIVGALVFLCSPAAAFVTGHILVVDGGWTAA